MCLLAYYILDISEQRGGYLSRMSQKIVADFDESTEWSLSIFWPAGEGFASCMVYVYSCVYMCVVTPINPLGTGLTNGQDISLSMNSAE